MKKITLAILALVFLSSALVGCNTLRGAGKDISDTGEHIQHVGR